MSEKVLGKDYVILKNPSSVYNGLTLCEKPMENFFLTESEVEIDCPDCIKKATA